MKYIWSVEIQVPKEYTEIPIKRWVSVGLFFEWKQAKQEMKLVRHKSRIVKYVKV